MLFATGFANLMRANREDDLHGPVPRKPYRPAALRVAVHAVFERVCRLRPRPRAVHSPANRRVGDTMPQSDRRGISTRAAILLATAAWLAGCVPIDDGKMEAASVTAEALPGPVALAPEVTGPLPAEITPDKIAAVLTAPKPGPAPEPSPAPTPASAAPPPGPPPVKCPPDTVGKWSGPDVVGLPVYICRHLTSG